MDSFGTSKSEYPYVQLRLVLHHFPLQATKGNTQRKSSMIWDFSWSSIQQDYMLQLKSTLKQIDTSSHANITLMMIYISKRSYAHKHTFKC